MTIRLELDPSFEKELLRSRFVAMLLEDLTEEGAELYRAGVPKDTYDLVDSIFADVALTPEGFRGRVGASDWKAALIEFGTSLRDPDASLRNAIEALGLTIEEV